MANTIKDEVLERRDKADRLLARSAKKLSSRLLRLREDLKDALKGFKDSTDDDGNLLNNSESRAALKKSLKVLDKQINTRLDEAQEFMIDTKEKAFEQTFKELSSSVSKLTGEKLNVDVSFEQANVTAAERSFVSKSLGIETLKLGSKAFGGTRKWAEARIKTELTTAILNGDSLNEVSKRLSSALDITIRSATRIARTNINAAMNDAHRAVYEENDDIFMGYRWEAVLDSRTSEICKKLDGKFFPLGSKPPGPPAHPNCRSVLVGVFRDPEVERKVGA